MGGEKCCCRTLDNCSDSRSCMLVSLIVTFIFFLTHWFYFRPPKRRLLRRKNSRNVKSACPVVVRDVAVIVATSLRRTRRVGPLPATQPDLPPRLTSPTLAKSIKHHLQLSALEVYSLARRISVSPCPVRTRARICSPCFKMLNLEPTRVRPPISLSLVESN
jgi:hypothetical protein